MKKVIKPVAKKQAKKAAPKKQVKKAIAIKPKQKKIKPKKQAPKKPIQKAPKVERVDKARLFKLFPYIAAWGNMVGRDEGFILLTCLKAEKLKAPVNAIFYNDDAKQWNTTDNIASDETKKRLEVYIKT